MPKFRVTSPDGAVYEVNAPEGATEQEAIAYVQQQHQAAPVGVAEDVAKTIPSAAVRGVANLAGAPADIMGLLSSGAASLFSRFVDPKTAEVIKEAAKPELPMPGSQNIQRGVEAVTGKLYEPKTRTGKFVGGVTEAAAPGGLFGKAQAGLGAISGLASETAGALTNDNPIAKGIAGVAAPVGVQAAAAMRSVPGQMVREATGDITPEQFEQARQMIARAKAQGIDLMAPEALPPSSIQQLMSDVLASKEGGRVVNQFLTQRPGQVKAAVDANLLQRVGGAGTPDQNMARARQAATDIISQAEKSRTATVRPFYEAAKSDPAPDIEAIVQNLQRSREFVGPGNQGAIDDIIAQLQGTPKNAAAMDDTLKALKASADAPDINATPAQRAAKGVYGGASGELDTALKQASPNIQRGRETYRDITENVINPLTAGPVGRVAGKHGIDPSLPENLAPLSAVANEKIARPESIRELHILLNRRDPQAFPGIARTWLENAFDQAAQKVQAGENRMVGANFAKAVFGTPQQEANFLETMRGVAVANGKNPDDVARGVKNLMEILQATGKVAGVGSPTGGRLATNEMARNSRALDVVESVSATPMQPLARRMRNWMMGGNYKRLAEVLTAPDSIDRIIEIGKYKPTTTTGMALAIGLLEPTSAASSAR